jgi:hypothetical protein
MAAPVTLFTGSDPVKAPILRQSLHRTNEKGGVVRRPFSKLQAWLIAVSPNRESRRLIGTGAAGLERITNPPVGRFGAPRSGAFRVVASKDSR